MTLTPARAAGRRRLAPEEAYARALAGQPCAVVADDGTVTSLQSRRWLAEADDSDRRLFVEPCSGPTLDVGCGPGRLLVALQRRRVDGARDRRLRRRRRPRPGTRRPRDPARRVRRRPRRGAVGARAARRRQHRHRWRPRAAARPGRRDCCDPAAGCTSRSTPATAAAACRTQRVRLQVGGHSSTPFRWATVDDDAIGRLADLVGLRLLGVDRHAGRSVAVLAAVG